MYLGLLVITFWSEIAYKLIKGEALEESQGILHLFHRKAVASHPRQNIVFIIIKGNSLITLIIRKEPVFPALLSHPLIFRYCFQNINRRIMTVNMK